MGNSRFTRSYRIGASLLSLTTLASLWFAAPSRGQVVVSGPTDSQAQRLQVWYEHHIPVRFRAHSRLLVREFDDAQMNAYLKADECDADGTDPRSHTGDDSNGDGDIDGVFESAPDRIALRLPSEGEPDMFTFAHEYGHYVWFNLLSKDDRKRYEGLYNRQRAGHHLVTRYAETDLEEGFAEAFSFYACEPVILARRDPLSSQFLTHWVNSALTP